MRILVAMSGGVDSSVAAAILRDEGHDCVGLFMRNGSHRNGSHRNGAHTPSVGSRPRGCCSVEDAADARRVAARLGIPFYALDFEDAFEATVIRDFVRSYREGRTPNPCILCNRDLKFGRLLETANELGAEAVATGHYARIVDGPAGRPALARPRDRAKDQTYVLYPLGPEVLARVVLPLGDLAKDEVRQRARDLGLVTADKPESQEICFVPEGDYRGVLRERDPDGGRPGDVVDRDGRVLGRHEGIRDFTVGQRRGLGLALGRPMYVVALDPVANRVVLGDREDLLETEAAVEDAVWSGREPLAAGETSRGFVSIRYQHAAAPATVTGDGDGRFRVRFDAPQSAITPGQAAVVYDESDERLLGGGRLCRA